uniref:Uncharacterized protein n=1 Tax=Romanomermis culicivorax TaxID=13658 RepID=A0A915K3A9_ROMCU
CVPHDLRRLHTNTILKIYFQEFQSKVQEPGILGLNFTLENVAKIFKHSSAIQCLLGLPMTDFILKFLGKVDQDETGWRRETLLQRFKALYDDCAAYFRSSQSREFLQL